MVRRRSEPDMNAFAATLLYGERMFAFDDPHKGDHDGDDKEEVDKSAKRHFKQKACKPEAGEKCCECQHMCNITCINAAASSLLCFVAHENSVMERCARCRNLPGRGNFCNRRYCAKGRLHVVALVTAVPIVGALLPFATLASVFFHTCVY